MGGATLTHMEDTVAEAIAVPEEIRGKIPTNYGLSRGVAWLTLKADDYDLSYAA